MSADPGARRAGGSGRRAAGLAAVCALGLFTGSGAACGEPPPVGAPGDPPYDARVVRVMDGDSIEVETGGARIEIRVFGIDAPERGQPWSQRAREALSTRVAGRTLHVRPRDRDSYGRTVAELHLGAACIACELVRGGHAWVYRRYTDDPELLALESQARQAKRGLWGLPAPERQPPWEWRTRDRIRRATPAQTQTFRCGDKRHCREMESCEEARFHLRCGVSTLDGDRDGRPCESLCRAEAAGP